MAARNHPNHHWPSYSFGFVANFGNALRRNLIIWSCYKPWPGCCVSLAQLRRLRADSLTVR
jgi:hypothetical protein